MGIIISIICIIFVLCSPIIQVILSFRGIKGKSNLSIGAIFGICLLLGIVLPILSSVILIGVLPSGVKCVTGEVSAGILGIMFTVITTPIIGVVSYTIYRSKHQMIEEVDPLKGIQNKNY
jgi:hypothetical protein